MVLQGMGLVDAGQHLCIDDCQIQGEEVVVVVEVVVCPLGIRNTALLQLRGCRHPSVGGSKLRICQRC